MTASPATAYGLAILCVAIIACGQLLFKAVSGRIWPPAEFLHDTRAVAMLGFALTLYGIATVLWIFTLRTLPLGKAYMFMACSFLILPIAAHYCFEEPLTLNMLLGAGIIIAGIWITTL